jgi:adenylate cyclase
MLAMHVLFGAPGELPDHAARAVVCALAWMNSHKTFPNACGRKESPRASRASGGYAGPGIVGNFGGGRLFDYTAYGDTINVAR